MKNSVSTNMCLRDADNRIDVAKGLERTEELVGALVDVAVEEVQGVGIIKAP